MTLHHTSYCRHPYFLGLFESPASSAPSSLGSIVATCACVARSQHFFGLSNQSFYDLRVRLKVVIIQVVIICSSPILNSVLCGVAFSDHFKQHGGGTIQFVELGQLIFKISKYNIKIVFKGSCSGLEIKD